MPQRRLMLAVLFAFVVAFAVFAIAHILPPEPYGLADDWRVFYGAGLVVQHGGNPYDPIAIHAAEQAAQHYPHVQPSLDDFTDVPLIAWLLAGIARLPYWSSFVVYTSAGVALAATALVAWMREVGWRRGGAWVVAALCSWPMLLGFFSGQFDALLLAGLVASLLLMRRNMPLVAGLCMVVVLFKPHLMWPVPLLLWAAWMPDRGRAWRFAAMSTAVLVAGTVAGFVLVHGSGSFLAHVLGFGSRVGSVQPDLSGIPGLVDQLPHGALIAAAVATLGAASVLGFAWFAARDPRLRSLADDRRAMIPLVGLAVWLASAPYAHPNDDILLLPLIAVLVGERAHALTNRRLQVAVVACLAVTAAFLVSTTVGYAAIAAGVTLCAVQRARVTAPAATAFAIAAIALLPTVWPFHVVQVSLTPIAVTATAVAGVLVGRSMVRRPVPSPARRVPVGASVASGGWRRF